MLSNYQTLMQLHKARLVAVIRGVTEENTYKTAKACVKGNITNLEIAFTSPHVVTTIKRLCEEYKNNSQVVIGAGTVLDSPSARIAILAGAQFIVSPSYNKNVAELCNLYSIPYIPGCFTPTEVQHALESGANLIKIFPSSISGVKIINELKGPFPQINIMPSGGVTIENLKNWLINGAFAIGIGGKLVGPAKENNYLQVTKNAKEFSEAFNQFSCKE